MSVRFLLPALLATAAAGSLAGCNNFLAKNNPCGGIYPADGVAEIFGVHVTGQMVADRATYDFDAASTLGSSGDCTTFVSGTASTDGSGTTSVTVSCHDVDVTFVVPDVRALAAGDTQMVHGNVSAGGIGNQVPCRDITATMKIESATGAKTGSSPYVTADFLRSVTLDMTSDAPGTIDADGGADGGVATSGPLPRCALHVVAHAKADFAASDYSQATTSGEDHCPALPSK
jgi:hypothetical protein